MDRSTLLDGLGIDEKAREAISSGLGPMRERQVLAARAFLRIKESRHYLAEGCASLGEFGERNGYSASEARLLARVGKAMLLHPPVERLLLEGMLTLDAVGELARVFGDPRVESVHPRDAWIAFAEAESAKAFRERVQRRVRVAAQLAAPATTNRIRIA